MSGKRGHPNSDSIGTHTQHLRDAQAYNAGAAVRRALPSLTDKHFADGPHYSSRVRLFCVYCGRTATRKGILVEENGGWRCVARKQCDQNT